MRAAGIIGRTASVWIGYEISDWGVYTVPFISYRIHKLIEIITYLSSSLCRRRAKTV